MSRVHAWRRHQIAWLLHFRLTVVDGCRVPEDQRVTSYSSSTGKLRKCVATNVEHRAIVNDEQHVVDEVESSPHDTSWICAVVQVEAVVKKYTEVTCSGCRLNNDPTN